MTNTDDKILDAVFGGAGNGNNEDFQVGDWITFTKKGQKHSPQGFSEYYFRIRDFDTPYPGYANIDIYGINIPGSDPVVNHYGMYSFDDFKKRPAPRF